MDALHRGPSPAPRVAPAVRSLPPAPVPERIRLVPSSTAFLPRCRSRDLRLAVGPGPVVRLRYAGPRCHLPPLRLRAVAAAADGSILYDGPALAHEDLSGNYAVSGRAHGRLLTGCGPEPRRVTVSGAGLHATGTVRCDHGSSGPGRGSDPGHVRSRVARRPGGADEPGVRTLRPREEFPTPAFRVALPLLLAVGVALAVWLLRG